jgi:hypothetical protein
VLVDIVVLIVTMLAANAALLAVFRRLGPRAT